MARYRAIAADLAAKIRDGHYAPGAALPAQRELSAAYGVTLMTLRQALRELGDEGLIVQQPGKGTFVAPPHLAYQLGSLRSLADDLREQGYEVRTTVIDRARHRVSPRVAAQLRVRESETGLRLERVRAFAGRRAIHQISWVREPHGGRLLDVDFTVTSLYAALADVGVAVARASETIRPEILDADVAPQLDEDEGAPVLVSDRITYGPDGTAVVADRATILGSMMQVTADRAARFPVPGPAHGPAHRGEQRRLRDRDGDVVVAALDAEVAGQAAAAPDRVDRGARLAQQRRVRAPAEHGVLVAVRLRHAGDARQVGRRPAVGGGQQLGESLDRAAKRRGPAVAWQQFRRVAAQRRRTRRLKTDDGDARVDGRLQGAQRPSELAPGAVQLAGGDPGQTAADVLAGDRDVVARGFEHRHRGLADLGRERVGERVHPQVDGLAGGAGRAGLPVTGTGDRRPLAAREPLAEALRREARQIPPAVDATAPLHQRRRFTSAATGATRSDAFASRASPGDRVVSAAQRGSQPSE